MKKIIFILMILSCVNIFSFDIKIGKYSVTEFYDGEYEFLEEVSLLVEYSDILDMYSIKLMDGNSIETEMIFYSEQIEYNRFSHFDDGGDYNIYFKKNEIILYEDIIDYYFVCKIE